MSVSPWAGVGQRSKYNMKLIIYNLQYATEPGLSLAMPTDLPIQYLLAT